MRSPVGMRSGTEYAIDSIALHGVLEFVWRIPTGSPLDRVRKLGMWDVVMHNQSMVDFVNVVLCS